MPIYEYRCENGHNFELLQRMSDDSLTACTTCGAPVQRVFHPVAVHFKGSGFYNTDYGKQKRGKSSDGDSSGSGEKSSGSDSGGSSDSKTKSDSGSGDSSKKKSSDSAGSKAGSGSSKSSGSD